MDLTTEGRYRVLGRPRDPDELLLVELSADASDSEGDAPPEESYDPTYVDATGYEGDLAATVDSLAAGNVVDADLTWRDGDPRFADLSVVAETAFTFADGVTGMFEAAKQAWMVAEAENEGMNARVTRNTDGDPNAALYVFAKQSGARDLFEEFRDGVTPLEPLVRRVDVGGGEVEMPPESEQAREVFVLRPVDEPFLAVYIVFDREGMLASTVRDTYVRD
jgi:hypothetical protein